MYIGTQSLMKQYDQYLLNNGYTIEELVSLASDCLIKHIPENKVVTILCGPGNNGADGLSLGIKLYSRNQKVNLCIFEENKLSVANKYYLKKAIEKDVPIYYIENDTSLLEHLFEDTDIVVDAMFGFGLNSSPRGIYAQAISCVNQLIDQQIIAVDIPTGLDCNTGKPYDVCIYANTTITLTALKNGFLNPESLFYSGKVILELLDAEEYYHEVGLFEFFDHSNASSILLPRKFDGHKGSYGKVGLIVGCDQYKGAALLSTKSAVYTGAGLVCCISDEKVLNILPTVCLEATSTLRSSVLEDQLDRFDALLIGSGLGLTNFSRQYFKDLMTYTSQPLVIDGDGLTLLSEDLSVLNHHRSFILTPHYGEFKRLCPDCDNQDIMECVKRFAKEHHCVLVLKGPYTYVSDGNTSYRIKAGNKAMSIAGMGDTLAGIIIGLLSQGYTPIEAASLGVYIHGKSGDEIAKEQYSVIPTQLIYEIPKVMNKIMK